MPTKIILIAVCLCLGQITGWLSVSLCAQEEPKQSPNAAEKSEAKPQAESTADKPASSNQEQPATDADSSASELPSLLVDPEIEANDVEQYYSYDGFAWMPTTQRFHWRNVLRNSFYYNSNVFFTNKNGREEDSAVYALDYETELKYLQGRQFEVKLSAGVRYEHYFRQGFDEVLPRAGFDVKYAWKSFYISVEESIYRSNMAISAEHNEFSPWFRNGVRVITGVTYKRLLFEITSFHEYLNFEERRGDYQFYGQSYIIGYKILKGIYATVGYGWDIIDYLDPAIVNGRETKDTVGHHVIAGIRGSRTIELTRDLAVTLNSGMQFREDKVYWYAEANVEWKALQFDTRRLKIDFNFSQRTRPSVLGDFRFVSAGTVSVKYLFTRSLAAQGEFTVSYSRPLHATSSITYRPSVSVNYRFYRGVDIEVFYRSYFVYSNDPNQETSQHLTGVSILMTF